MSHLILIGAVSRTIRLYQKYYVRFLLFCTVSRDNILFIFSLKILFICFLTHIFVVYFSDTREGLQARLAQIVSVDLASLLSSSKSSDTEGEAQNGQNEDDSDPALTISGHLAEAQRLSLEINDSVGRQEAVMGVILGANEGFLRAKDTDPCTLERDRMVSVRRFNYIPVILVYLVYLVILLILAILGLFVIIAYLVRIIKVNQARYRR